MRLGNKRNSTFARATRQVLDQRYIKRNIILFLALAVSVTGIGTVIKYGEALDHTAAYETGTETEVVEVNITEDEYVAVSEAVEAVAETTAMEAATEESQAQEVADSGFFIAKIDSALNIREEASADSSIVGKLLDGNVGEILEVDGDWVKICSGDITGYVNSAYILTGDEALAYAEGFLQVLGTVTVETVRVRAERSTDSSILKLVSQGTVLTVLESDDEWVEVSLSGDQTGFVSAAFISVEESYSYAMTLADYMTMAAAEGVDTTSDTQAQLMDTVESSSTEATTQAATTDSPTTEATTQATTTEATTEATTTEAATTESTTVDASSYSDAYLLACLVSMEAGNESYEGQLAVANVVLNRLKSGSWGSTMYSVIYASGQFPSVTGSVMQSYLTNGPTSSAQQAANAALAGTNNVGSYTRFANVKYVDTDSLSDYVIIGNHCFY